MIKVRYSATEREDLVYHFSYDVGDGEGAPISPSIEELETQIKNSTPIFNYAAFFGDGIDLDDETLELGDESDYYGYIPEITTSEQTLSISFTRYTGEEAPQLGNGVTIEFNKYTCKRVAAVRDGVELGYVENENGLPKKVHIKFEKPAESWLNLDIVFSGFFENQPINIKGIILGNIIEVTDIMSFDMVAETNPISDDLAINETNISAVITEDFSEDFGQKITLSDKNELLENDILKSVEEADVDLYNIKARNKIELSAKVKRTYPDYAIVMSPDDDWNNYNPSVRDAFININAPEEVAGQRLSVFLPECTERQLMQQIAWAVCCGIDTTYRNEATLVPFFATDTTVPDITISNSDDRILKTSVTKGEAYSKIVWVKTKYTKENKLVNLGEATLKYDETRGRYWATMISNVPVIATETDFNVSISTYTPFRFAIHLSPDETNIPLTIPVRGYKYSKYDERVEISTGISGSDTLEITNQTLYPIDDTQKIAQLKKWYSKNNTLSATVVDNDSQIRLGKVVKIQLKKGDYFQGIVTKVVRNNIGDYHTVDLEAHEWN